MATSRPKSARSNRPRFEPLEPRLLLADSPLTISEFMASNGTQPGEDGLLDGDGNSSDWIEIHNSAGTPKNLEGYYLTDNLNDPMQWPLPDVTIGANGYLVVFTSNGREDVHDPAKAPFRDTAGNLHTNFKLDADGSKGYGLAGIRLQEVAPFGSASWLERSGNTDRNSAADFARVRVPSKDSRNPDLTVPFASEIPATTAIGFSNNQPQFDENIQTHVGFRRMPIGGTAGPTTR